MDLLEFHLPAETTHRNWGIYVIIAEHIETKKVYLYVGKVGDNRKGCNPIISRIGNHFSFNGVHSQFRNNITNLGINPNSCNYRIFYKLFDEYSEEVEEVRIHHKNITNERERHLNIAFQNIIKQKDLKINFLNVLANKTNLKVKEEREKILNEIERNEIKKFAENVINKSTYYNSLSEI